MMDAGIFLSGRGARVRKNPLATIKVQVLLLDNARSLKQNLFPSSFKLACFIAAQINTSITPSLARFLFMEKVAKFTNAQLLLLQPGFRFKVHYAPIGGYSPIIYNN